MGLGKGPLCSFKANDGRIGEVEYMEPCVLAVSSGYGSVLFILVFALVLSVVILAAGHLIGPRRHGEVKESTYESGMPVIGDARRRFNVRFYEVAMLFLLFDVEVVFLWPWAKVFYRVAMADAAGVTPAPGEVTKAFLAGAMLVFGGILVVGFAYEWRKGVFKWS